MELKGKDSYKIEIYEALSEAQLYSLVTCYQALIGPTATALYLTLAEEAMHQHGAESHQRLCALMGIDIVAFELARGKCEEVHLILTWQKKTDNRDLYLYTLKAPLKAEEFLSHDVLGRRYLQLVGARNAETTRMKAVAAVQDKTGYTNISRRFRASELQSWGQMDEKEFNRVKPMMFSVAADQHIEFDYETFLSESTNLSFPIEARTQEALQMIGELATVYGISADRMRILVGHSINNSTNVLDIQKLKRLASFEKPKASPTENPYEVSPVQFLLQKQGGIPVTPADARLLEYLVRELKMPQAVVNVLVETVLMQNENRLSRSYVEKIAGSWIRNKVDTLAKAQAAAAETRSSGRNSKTVRKAILPENFKAKQSVQPEDSKDAEKKTVSEEEVQALKERLKRLEG